MNNHHFQKWQAGSPFGGSAYLATVLAASSRRWALRGEKKKKPVTFLWQNYFKAKHLEGQQYINFYFKLFCLVLKSTQNVKSSLPYFVNMSKTQCVPVHQNGCLQSPFRKEISVISLQRIWLKDRQLISFRLKSALWRMTSPQKAFNVNSCRVLQTFWVLWASTITAALMKK